MDKANLLYFLQSTQVIPAHKAEQIAKLFTPKNIAKNNLFLKEGQVCNEYLFLDAGYMRAFAYNTEGHEITTGFYSPKQVVFEVSSFFNHTASKENIVALTDCAGWFITYAQLNHLFHALPEFREFGRSILVRGYAALKTRMLATITETAEERYGHLIQSNPEIFQQMPLKHIATYLGITDSSLSRIRKEYARK